jgi:hypothetical protein
MRLAITTLTALGLLFGAAAVQAAEESGASENSPAIQKNEQGAVPDASGSSAGHQEQDEGSASGSSGAKDGSTE